MTAEPAPHDGAMYISRGLDHLRAHGHKLTPQRRAVLEVLASEPSHMTPSAIYEKLLFGDASLSRATVYNTLELFAQTGLIARLRAEDGQIYIDRNTDPHHHAVCAQCGTIFDLHLPPGALTAMLAGAQLDAGDDHPLPAQPDQLHNASLWVTISCPSCADS